MKELQQKYQITAMALVLPIIFIIFTVFVPTQAHAALLCLQSQQTTLPNGITVCPTTIGGNNLYSDTNGNLYDATGALVSSTNSGGSGIGSFVQNGTGAPAVQATCTAKLDSWSAFFNTSCWPSLISGVIGGALVSLAAWTLAVAGILFNAVLGYTVLQFGQLINGTAGNGSIITGINIAWSACRDLS